MRNLGEMNEQNESNEKPQNGDLPVNPPSLAADAAAKNGRTIRLTEPANELGVITLPAGIRKLQRLGISAKTVGLAEVSHGSMLVTYEGLQDVKDKVIDTLRECQDAESVAMLANAFASLVKAEAAFNKSFGGLPSTEGKDRRGRRTFAKGQLMGPPIDVKAS